MIFPTSLLVLFLITSSYHLVLGETWAILIASSYGYWNYRHQSDIFHAYQTLTRNGIKPSNIIVFAYDDIVNDPNNPFPGSVFNAPSNTTPYDVYKGIKIDYKGKDVNPSNFLNVLKGNSSAGLTRVLNSTNQDNVFIYFSDHGVSGGLMFPNSQYLWADQLIETLQYMYKKNMYKKLVFYLEACKSGSIFQNRLSDNINVYAVTATNSVQDSWGTYCPPFDYVNGSSIGTCLGDLFSVNWLLNADVEDLFVETLKTQYLVVKNATNMSQVMQFGNISIQNDIAGNFQAGPKKSMWFTRLSRETPSSGLPMNSRMAKYFFLKELAQKKPTEANKALFEAEIQTMFWFDSVFEFLNHELNIKIENQDSNLDINFECLREFVDIFGQVCRPFTEYGAQYVTNLNNFCSDNVSIPVFKAALRMICS